MFDRSEIREGMPVFSADGEKLGKVQSCSGDTFIIEKGFFFPKDYVARMDDVTDLRDGQLWLSRTKEGLIPAGEASSGAWTEPRTTTTATGYEAGAASMGTPSASDEVRVPLAEEELDVTKRQRDAGEVRLRKDVVTETRRVDVPVTREEVHVEHVPASEARPADADAFEQRTVSMPVKEEEVEITKRPVVKEEVRLRKDRRIEQRAAEEEVRKERIDVEGEGIHAVRDEDLSPKRE